MDLTLIVIIVIIVVVVLIVAGSRERPGSCPVLDPGRGLGAGSRSS